MICRCLTASSPGTSARCSLPLAAEAICNCRGTSYRYSSRDDTVGAVLLWARTCPPFRPAALSARCFSCTALRSALVRAGAAAAGRAGRAAFAAPASVRRTDIASMLDEHKRARGAPALLPTELPHNSHESPHPCLRHVNATWSEHVGEGIRLGRLAHPAAVRAPAVR